MRRKRGRSPESSPGPCRKRARRVEQVPSPETLMLRLKIQRLRGEDFFVSIGGKDLVTQLKEQVLHILKTGDTSEVWAEVTNLRLIYKGKVLVDAKSIEFYKIQNDDTIQLVPFRRRRNPSRSSRSGESPDASHSSVDTEPSQPELGGSRRNLAGRGPIAFLTLSTSVVGGPPRPRSIGGRSQRVESQQQRQANPGQIRNSDAPAPLRLPASPATSTSLRRFKEQLLSTLFRVNAAERGESVELRRELANQLNGLIRDASALRTHLLEQSQRPSVFAATAQDGVFSLVEGKEENELETNLRRSESRRNVAPLVRTSTSTSVSALARSSRRLSARLSEMNILAVRDMHQRHHQALSQRGPRRRSFSSQRPVGRSQFAFRGRGRNTRNGVLRALVVSPIGGLDTHLRPLVGVRITGVPRRPEQSPPETSSGNGPTESSPIARREDSGSRSPRLRRWAAPDVGNSDVLIEFLDRFINGRQ